MSNPINIRLKLLLTDLETVDHVNIYRSLPPIDVDNLGEPYATVPSGTSEYIDQVEIGDVFHYVVSNVSSDGNEVLSNVIEIHGDEDVIIFSNTNSSVVRFNSTGQPVKSGPSVTGSMYGMDVDGDGNIYLIGNSTAAYVSKYGVDGDLLWQLDSTITTTGYPYSMVYDARGYVYMMTNTYYLIQLNASTGEKNWEVLTDHTSTVYNINIDMYGRILSASNDDTVKCHDSTGSLIWSYYGHTDGVYDVTTVGGTSYVSCGSDNCVNKFTEMSDGQLITDWIVPLPSGSIYPRSVSYNKNQDKVLVGFRYGFFLLDNQTGEILTEVTGTSNYEDSVMLTDAGLIYVNNSSDGLRRYDSDGNVIWRQGNTASVVRIITMPGRQGNTLGIYNRV